MLGRSYDADGFLIEAPQVDGSRWIGYVAWRTGELTWLVSDEFVNAFGCLGPDGRLAWSRRSADADDDAHFELVIRHGERQWTLHSPRESWLMPTWSWSTTSSGRGDGLFVLSLAEGHLEAVFAIAADEASFRQSRQRLALAIEASVYSAYQAISAQVSGPGSTGVGREQLIFFHPSQMRMAMWRPTSGGISAARGNLSMFDRLSYAAVIHDEDHAIVTTEEQLIVRNIHRERDRAHLIAGMHVARTTPMSGVWPYILLSPGDGAVAVIPMRPLGASDLARW
jgi:hypothetical protein